jgi:hypothetical protein
MQKLLYLPSTANCIAQRKHPSIEINLSGVLKQISAFRGIFAAPDPIKKPVTRNT